MDPMNPNGMDQNGPGSQDMIQRLLSQSGALEQLMELSGMGDQRGILDQQIAQAQALRQPSGRQYHTGIGAAMGGLGDGIRGIMGGVQERQLRGEQQDLIKQQVAARKLISDIMFGRGGSAAAAMNRQPDPAAESQMNAQPPSPMGY